MRAKTLSGFVIVAVTIIACTSPEQKQERLAKKYCSSCHQYTDPSLLDKKTWRENVLPRMAFRMGVSVEALLGGISSEDMNRVLSTIPSEPVVSDEEWANIQNYFLTHAPDSLTITRRIIENELTAFAASSHHIPRQRFVTMLEFDERTKTTLLGTRSSMLYRLDSAFMPIDSIRLESPASHVEFGNDGMYVSIMGIMDPNDQAKGKILLFPGERLADPKVLQDSLQRPVHVQVADLNNDQINDLIVCSFGNFTGQLEILEGTSSGRFRKHIISYQPGARKVVCHDFNQDGLMDFVTLMTQGDERLILFMNNGDFDFHQRTLLRFPAVYGSSYFELADFNDDGHRDILYANGDNADYSRILKPYHGLKIFENNGKNHFGEAWSFQMHGASEAEARDFDNDGDLDIAAISFFPDTEKLPEQGFIYFENRGSYNFEPRVTENAVVGRWRVLESADFDNDSDIDIALGNGHFNLPKAADKNLTFLLLRNRSAQPVP